MVDVSDNNALYYYHYDGLGSVVALLNSSGTVVETYEYDAFGNTTIKNASSQIIDESAYDNPYMYTGRRYDPETGLYYYRARIYSPAIGRFLQPDPIGYADGMNIYAYCGNNPVNWIDPTGTDRYIVFDSNYAHWSVAVDLWAQGSDGVWRKTGKKKYLSIYGRPLAFWREGLPGFMGMFGWPGQYYYDNSGFRELRIKSNWRQDQALLRLLEKDEKRKYPSYSIVQGVLKWTPPGINAAILSRLFGTREPEFCWNYSFERAVFGGRNPFKNDPSDADESSKER